MAKDARFQEAVWFLALSEDPESIKVSTSNIRSLVTRESIYNQLSSPSDLHLDHSHQLRRHILHTNPLIIMTTSLNMFIKTLVAVIALAATALSSPTSETSSSQIQTRVV
jgi:hypothetical protein